MGDVGTSGSHLARIGNPGPVPPPLIPGPAAITRSAPGPAGKKPWPNRSLKLTGANAGSNQAGPSRATNTPNPAISGPIVSVPGDNRVNAPNLPQFLKNLPTNPTFPDADSAYSVMRNWLASRAFNPYLELVIVKSSLMYMKPGNKRPSVVSVSSLPHMSLSSQAN